MKIAISTDGDSLSAHFGRCPSFTIIEIDDGKLISKQVITNPGHYPEFLPQFLHQKGVHYIIAGGIGHRAEELFAQAGIQTIMGVSGSIDEVIDKIIKGTLEGGESLCRPGAGRGYGIEKAEYEHPEEEKMYSETKSASSAKGARLPDGQGSASDRGGKICLTSQGDNLESFVDPRFGRCQYFIIIDPGTLEFEAVENPSLVAGGGAGIQSSQLIVNKGVEAVLTGNVGPNAFATLQAAGIKIISGVRGKVSEAIEKYKKGEFSPLVDGPDAAAHFGIGIGGDRGITKDEELSKLKEQAKTMQEELKQITQKIEELNKNETGR